MPRILAIASAMAILSACAAPASSVAPSSVQARADGTAAALPSETAANAFPVGAFKPLRERPMPAGMAARLKAAIAQTAGNGGIAATVLSPDGSWSGTSGTADGVHALQPDSQFGIASVTKSIVAAQVMQMVEAGELDLDAPATEYLPSGFPFDTNGATIRQLLSHRSGIPDWYGPAMEAQVTSDRRHAWTAEEVLARVDAARAPAGSFEYGDTNYTLLGLVVERVHGQRLVEVLRDGVLRVAGTGRLIYQPDEAPTAPMAMPGGEALDALDRGGGVLPSMSEATSCRAACAMASDSISLARWWRALCAGEVVSQASLTAMATFYDNVEIDYGLGLFNPLYAQGNIPAVGHLGSSYGYKAAAGCLIELHAVFVVLTNDPAIDSQDLAPLLVRALAD